MMRANTFSICAVDRERGEAGVAVASRCMAVGKLVPFAQAGAGAIATQAVVGPRYGVVGIDLMSKGMPAPEALELLKTEDLTVTEDSQVVREYYKSESMHTEGVDYTRDEQGRLIWFTRRIRQVGMVDWEGRSAAYSGPCIFKWAGSVTGPGYACQGNMVGGPAVVERMAEVYIERRDAGDPLQRSLMLALAAGEAAGGDSRGKQSAALLIVKHRGHYSGLDDRINVRIDDDPDPIRKLELTVAKY